MFDLETLAAFDAALARIAAQPAPKHAVAAK
jgi:hypothetical protein